MTALTLAAKQGKKKVVKVLLAQKDIDVNKQDNFVISTKFNSNHFSIFIIIIIKSHTDS